MFRLSFRAPICIMFLIELDRFVSRQSVENLLSWSIGHEESSDRDDSVNGEASNSNDE